MTPELALVYLSCVLAGVAIGVAIYIWCRLRCLERDVYRIAWDLEALAGALAQSYEEGR